jgi:hypothetical protein
VKIALVDLKARENSEIEQRAQYTDARVGPAPAACLSSPCAMAPIKGPGDGPVAVTGASGYIGSHVVKNLVVNGYGRGHRSHCRQERADG